MLGSAIHHHAIPGSSIYAASKAALTGFTRSVSAEMAPFQVRVNCIEPGYFSDWKVVDVDWIDVNVFLHSLAICLAHSAKISE